jgi:uncharacterized membrane protein YedE/YeeE
MQEADLPRLLSQVLSLAFAFAVVFGAIAQRTHFCTMGAVADIVNMGDWGRMRMWLLAIGVATLGFNAMVALGWVQAQDSVYAAPRLLWLSHAVGGLMFGFGMVLTSGCGSKTLVRIGGGSLKSLVVFVVLGLAAYATLRGITAVARVATVDAVGITLPAGQDLPSLLALWTGAPRTVLAGWLGGGIGLGLVGLALSRREGRSAEVLLGGLGIGAVIVAVWWLSGRLAHLDEHPVTLEAVFLATNSKRMEALSFVAPFAYTLDWLILFSDTSKVLTIGIVATLGLVVGSAAVSLLQRSFRWEGFGGVEDTANHLLGAVLMGVGGVTALGCTVGQGLSGVSTLSVGSYLSVAAIVLGAVAALRYQVWRLERMV